MTEELRFALSMCACAFALMIGVSIIAIACNPNREKR